MRCALAGLSVLILLCGQPAQSADRSCWTDLPGEKPRPDVTCKALTEGLLRSIEGASPTQVVRMMEAPGSRSPDGLHYHYMSNYLGSRGRSGDVNITFENGRAVIVEAFLDKPDEDGPLEFLWNAREGSCSDFPGSPQRCSR